MCGIGIVPRSELRETLLNQVDRGLDSVGVLSYIGGEQRTNKAIRDRYKGYKKFMKDKISETENMVLLHHRKASVGAVNMDNSHPFHGAYFKLMQNGTSRKFYNKYKDVKYLDADGKELPAAGTDSETLLRYIETKANTIYDVPEVLDKLADETFDVFGIIILTDRYGNILIYADGSRESNIEIENGYVKRITNYIPGKNWGYENIGYILMNIKGKVLENTFIDVNTEKFVAYVYTPPKTDYSHWDEYKGGNGGHVPYASRTPIQSKHGPYVPDSELDKELGWVKLLSKLDNDESLEYDFAEKFFRKHIVDMSYLSWEDALQEYLEYTYSVKNSVQYYMSCKDELPLQGIKRGYVTVMGRTI